MAIPAQMITWVVMENSCGLNNLGFVPQKSQQQQQLEHTNSFLQKDTDDHHSMFYQNQTDEIDLLVNAQNERLRTVLQEQRKRELTLFMKRYEWLIKQRDEEFAKAANRNMELQNHVKRMELEVQRWQRLAEEKESMVASLNDTIQRLRDVQEEEDGAEDAESCCGVDDQETRKMVCRCCNSRKSCVVMLPCRHLSSCKSCDQFLDSCPLCNQLKKFSIEALL